MPTSTLQSLVYRPCPVCGSTDESQVFAESNIDPSRLNEFAFASRKVPEYMHHRLLTCPTCDLLYASPLPTVDAVATAYEEAAYDSGDEARYAARTYAKLVAPLLKSFPDRAGAMDIGAGDGVFLEELVTLGFTDIIGVEPSSAPIKAASEVAKPLLRQAMFNAQDFQPGSFRLITCFQTMEHLHDPLSMCRDALHLLKPDGALLLVGHNRKSPVNRMLGRKSPIFDIEHLQLFSPQSAHALMERSGLKDISIQEISNTYPLRYWTRLFPMPPAAKQGLSNMLNGIGLGKLPIPLPVGNQAIIGFKRS